MRQAEVVIGETYISRVSGRLVVVRVDSSHVYDGYRQRAHRRFDVTNLMTGRKLQMSAAKLRDRAEKNSETGKWRRATTPTPVIVKHRGMADSFTLDNMPRADGKTPNLVKCRHCPREMHLEFVEEHERVCYLNPGRVSDFNV